MPYPLPPLGSNYQDFLEEYQFQIERRGDENSSKLTRVPGEFFNPYAVGHMVNHPPPDTSANVKFVDFDLPYTFFPSALGKYLPYINSRETVMKRSSQAETRSNDVMRAVAMVSQQIISDGDELYVDYL